MSFQEATAIISSMATIIGGIWVLLNKIHLNKLAQLKWQKAQEELRKQQRESDKERDLECKERDLEWKKRTEDKIARFIHSYQNSLREIQEIVENHDSLSNQVFHVVRCLKSRTINEEPILPEHYVMDRETSPLTIGTKEIEHIRKEVEIDHTGFPPNPNYNL